jgi:hypothetical protein
MVQKYTFSDVRQATLKAGSNFFTRETMKHWNDKAKNYRVINHKSGRTFIHRHTHSDPGLVDRYYEFFPKTGRLGTSLNRDAMLELGFIQVVPRGNED